MLTQHRLRKLLSYCPQTGIFRWRPAAQVPTKPSVRANEIAGYIRNGYWMVGVDGREYRAHRLAVLYMTGEWPSKLVDHEDTNKLNNRWSNLRQATNSQNQQNLTAARRSSKSGHLGVTWYTPTSKWLARITVDGTIHHLGYHSKIEQAVAAYADAKKRLHPFSSVYAP